MSFNIRIIFFVSIMLFHLQVSASMSDSLRIEKSKGKKFIVHRVEPKETLYSISKKYEISIEDIQKFNPEVENGLKMYQEILILISKKKAEKETVAKDQSKPPSFHIVQQGETMYAISRKYNLSIDTLKSYNQMSSTNLNLGDTLLIIRNERVIVKKSALTVPKSTEKDKLETIVPTQKNDQIQSENIYHTVTQGETMFALSRQYDASLENLTVWNNMDSFELEIGQQLIVGKKTSSTSLIKIQEPAKTVVEPKITAPEEPEKIKTESQAIAKKPAENDTIFLKTETKPFRTKYEEVEGKTFVLEEGFVMKMENTDHVTKYLALHKTAPIGSSIQVVNTMNGFTVDVKIVGQLPETALDRNVMMRLSSAAFKKLASPDQKIPVKTKYVKD